MLCSEGRSDIVLRFFQYLSRDKRIRLMQKIVLKLVTLILMYCTLTFNLKGADLPRTLSADAHMSILVASPSPMQAYTMYGHAGYRVYDEQLDLDVTFNYGIFQFDDTFLFRFVKGQTDYLVLPQPTSEYMDEYLSRGSRVEELHLNLRPDEQAKIWAYLLRNIQPEHRVYRYNFFRDNCATRLIDIIEVGVGQVQYTEPADYKASARQSWRSEINDLERANPWLVLGTDLALGSPTDSLMSWRERAFSPRYLKSILESAHRLDGTPIYGGSESFGYDTAEAQYPESWTSYIRPDTVLVLFVLLMIYLYIYRIIIKRKPVCKGWDALIMSIIGIIGIVLCFIAFFSEHPMVYPNANILLFNPLHLFIGLPVICLKRCKKIVVWYHFATFASVSALVLHCVGHIQHINVAVIELSISILMLILARRIEARRSKD